MDCIYCIVIENNYCNISIYQYTAALLVEMVFSGSVKGVCRPPTLTVLGHTTGHFHNFCITLIEHTFFSEHFNTTHTEWSRISLIDLQVIILVY